MVLLEKESLICVLCGLNGNNIAVAYYRTLSVVERGEWVVVFVQVLLHPLDNHSAIARGDISKQPT